VLVVGRGVEFPQHQIGKSRWLVLLGFFEFGLNTIQPILLPMPKAIHFRSTNLAFKWPAAVAVDLKFTCDFI